MAKRKSTEERARKCVSDIRRLNEFAEEESRKRGQPYTEAMRFRDAILVVDLAMKRLVEADRRARKAVPRG